MVRTRSSPVLGSRPRISGPKTCRSCAESSTGTASWTAIIQCSVASISCVSPLMLRQHSWWCAPHIPLFMSLSRRQPLYDVVDVEGEHVVPKDVVANSHDVSEEAN